MQFTSFRHQMLATFEIPFHSKVTTPNYKYSNSRVRRLFISSRADICCYYLVSTATAPMGFTNVFELNGVHINTIVTSTKKQIDGLLESMLPPADDNDPKVIGFDTEWTLFQNEESEEVISSETKCATLNLCDGFTCLIIQLNQLDSVPTSLLNFLRLPDYTFVGVGIKENLAKLEKQFGLGCRNAVELGPLAASVMKMPRLSSCGVDALASAVCKLDLRKHRPLSVVFNDWGQSKISKKLAKLAAVNVYSYYEIGCKLLGEESKNGDDA